MDKNRLFVPILEGNQASWICWEITNGRVIAETHSKTIDAAITRCGISDTDIEAVKLSDFLTQAAVIECRAREPRVMSEELRQQIHTELDTTLHSLQLRPEDREKIYDKLPIEYYHVHEAEIIDPLVLCYKHTY